MARNPEAEFSMINISLADGSNYGCAAVLGTILNGEPAITFISSGYATTVLLEEVTKISLSVDCWCPRCE